MMKKMLMMMTALLISTSAMAADKAADVVEKANQQWNEAFNQADAAKLATFYADMATLSPGNGAVLTGPDAIEELFSGFFDNGVHSHQIETIDVMTSGKQITQVGYWQAEGKNAEQENISFGGVLVIVLQQNNAGEWEILSHVWNMAN